MWFFCVPARRGFEPEKVAKGKRIGFIRSNTGKWSVNAMCRILKISESGYYKHLRNENKPYRYASLLDEIYRLLDEDPENSNYGMFRIYEYLKIKLGYAGGYGKIRRICRDNGLTIKRKRKPNGITKADREAEKSENLIKQDFSALKPNEKWLTDITEIPCSDGKLYFAPVLDCFDGSIRGFAMDDNMRKELCITAFRNACRRDGARNMILHSDRGSQFTSADYRMELKKHGAVQSMSGAGRCYDNARMESFFATLKKERLYQIKTEKLPMSEVRSMVYRFVCYYNLRRIYTVNGGYPPLVYREMYYAKTAA